MTQEALLATTSVLTPIATVKTSLKKGVNKVFRSQKIGKDDNNNDEQLLEDKFNDETGEHIIEQTDPEGTLGLNIDTSV